MNKKIINKIGIGFSSAELEKIDKYLNIFESNFNNYLDNLNIILDTVPISNFPFNNLFSSIDLLSENTISELNLNKKLIEKNSINFKNNYFVLNYNDN